MSRRPFPSNSRRLDFAVVVAVSIAGMVQVAIHEVINVIPVRHRFMSAVRTVRVLAMDLRSALHGICGVYCDDMFRPRDPDAYGGDGRREDNPHGRHDELRCVRNPGHAYECGLHGVFRYMQSLAILLALVCHRYPIIADNSEIVAEANDA